MYLSLELIKISLKLECRCANSCIYICLLPHPSDVVPEEKYLTLEGFHKFAVDRAKQDIRSVWRAILACGYDLHFER